VWAYGTLHHRDSSSPTGRYDFMEFRPGSDHDECKGGYNKKRGTSVLASLFVEVLSNIVFKYTQLVICTQTHTSV